MQDIGDDAEMSDEMTTMRGEGRGESARQLVEGGGGREHTRSQRQGRGHGWPGRGVGVCGRPRREKGTVQTRAALTAREMRARRWNACMR